VVHHLVQTLVQVPGLLKVSPHTIPQGLRLPNIDGLARRICVQIYARARRYVFQLGLDSYVHPAKEQISALLNSAGIKPAATGYAEMVGLLVVAGFMRAVMDGRLRLI
jgi:hypothetical protein